MNATRDMQCVVSSNHRPGRSIGGARHRRRALFIARLLLVAASGLGGRRALANAPPVADAGLPRYAAQDPVRLDGSGSHDPDRSGPLTYNWGQVSGPPLVLTGADTATPTVGGFIQTEVIQTCEFELVVTDGELPGRPDRVGVIIVPRFGDTTLCLENDSFDPNKPTFIFFGGGDCVNGYSGQPWSGGLAWTSKANVIGFPDGYAPDIGGSSRTYFRYGDMLVTYLSAVAPNYEQPIQTAGHSTGGQPAVDAAIRLNGTYRDARYAVNRVSFLDATAYCRASYQESIDQFLACPVDGEPCWIDNYVGTLSGAGGKNNVLNVWFDRGNDMSLVSTERHRLPRNWYRGFVAAQDPNQFNHGVVAGTYWSVIGLGKNLQLASTPEARTYHFTWYGDALSGHMELYDGQHLPACLPEPVTLGAWASTEVSGASDGAVLSCHESENAVGYELLFGSDPYKVAHYQVISDTPRPPMDVLRNLPPGPTWWTVRVRDRYGSTIYADPVRLDLTSLRPLSVENARTGKRYGLISHAILDAEGGDVILVNPGTYDENIQLGGKTLTVRSLDPNDPVVVGGTIVRGRKDAPAVTFSGPASTGGVLAGLTIQSRTVGVSCQEAIPTIRNCVLESPEGIALEFWHGRSPKLLGCTLVGQVKEGGDPGLIAYWKLDETQGMVAHDSEGTNDATVFGLPHWQPQGGKVGGALELSGLANFATAKSALDPSQGPLSVFAWVKGGAPGQVILAQAGGANWVMAGTATGALATELKESGRTGTPLASGTIITDGNWHRVGLVWDGSNRILYVDDVEAARDTQTGLAGSTGNLTIGAGSTMTPAGFWKGLIDDVRMYDRAVKP